MRNVIKEIELGKINLESGSIFISDPCYNTDVWCTKYLPNIKKGEYICRATMVDEGSWGNRIAELTINHIKNSKNKSRTVIYHSIGVDSGQCGFFDYEYYNKHHNKSQYIDDTPEGKDWYERVCDITLNGDSCGTIDNLGVVSESGFGDGMYFLYAGYNSKDEIVSLRLKFI